jgi:3-oxoacyl-[acyl-carrier-protein] synthase-1
MDLVVSAVAACTPVGLHAASTCAALRAGLGNLMELSTHVVDSERFEAEPMIGGRVPTEWLDGPPAEEHWPGHERFDLPLPTPKTSRVAPGVERVLELCRIALGEIAHDARLEDVPRDRYRVYLGLNEVDPAALIADEVRGALGGDAERFVTETSGRAAGLSMLSRALNDLRERRTEGALIGGVDSLIRAPIAASLDETRRIRCKTAPEGSNPGEAAAFIYVESANQARRRRCESRARVSAVSIAEEPSAGRDVPNRGTGLSQALRAARRDAGLTALPLIVCDLNGERPRALEWMLAATRALGDLHGELEVWHPADCIGDAGAAAGIVDLAWAATALHQGYAPRDKALVWGASDGGLRAAAVVERNAE